MEFRDLKDLKPRERKQFMVAFFFAMFDHKSIFYLSPRDLTECFMEAYGEYAHVSGHECEASQHRTKRAPKQKVTTKSFFEDMGIKPPEGM
jgi:hypothetical protein